jgi:hypothetical protein
MLKHSTTIISSDLFYKSNNRLELQLLKALAENKHKLAHDLILKGADPFKKLDIPNFPEKIFDFALEIKHKRFLAHILCNEILQKNFSKAFFLANLISKKIPALANYPSFTANITPQTAFFKTNYDANSLMVKKLKQILMLQDY